MLLWAGCAARARLLQDHIPDWFSFRRRRRRQLDSEVKLDSLSSPKHPGLVPTLPCTTKGATAACSSFPSFPFKPSWIPVSVRLASRSSYFVSQKQCNKTSRNFFFFFFPHAPPQLPASPVWCLTAGGSLGLTGLGCRGWKEGSLTPQSKRHL